MREMIFSRGRSEKLRTEFPCGGYNELEGEKGVEKSPKMTVFIVIFDEKDSRKTSLPFMLRLIQFHSIYDHFSNIIYNFIMLRFFLPPSISLLQSLTLSYLVC